MQNNLQPFRGMEGNKVFYLHIPKTAGSAINKLFTGEFGTDRALTHIESKEVFGKEGCKQDVSGYRYLSGHISYPLAKQNIDIPGWVSVCTFRRPEEQLASHISWVRLLAEPGHEERLSRHTENIRKIVDYMKGIDLSSPQQVKKLIAWLEKHRFFVFHNSQTRYLCGGKPGKSIEPNLLQQALNNLDAIDLVGIVERMDEFLLMLAGMFQLAIDESSLTKENSNSERFGLDLSDPETTKIVEPLIAYDRIIYSRARSRFIDQYHTFLASLEKNMPLRHTTANVKRLMKEIIKT